MANRAPDRVPVPDAGRQHVRDTGTTSGGGSLGHVSPADVNAEGPVRNQAERRETDDPVMPSDDSTLNTKI